MTAVRVGLFAFVFLSSLLIPSPSPVEWVPGAPNILVIVTDDQRAQLTAMPKTRELFRDNGVTFSHAFASTPLCCPSRASLFTGRYAHNHGVFYNSYIHRLDQDTTIQRYLKDAGYYNGIFGKYFNEWLLSNSPPYFDDWAIFPQSGSLTYSDGPWNVNGIVRPTSAYSTAYIRTQADRFLADAEAWRDQQPWFLYLAPPAPHPPYLAEGKYADAAVPFRRRTGATFERNLEDKPPYVRNEACRSGCGNEIRRRQLRTLMSVDDMVDGIFRTLADYEEDQRTLAFFVSDNGSMWGEHGLSGKRVPYTEAIQIPMFMRWPGRVNPFNDQRLVSMVDIAPTIVDAAGIESAPTVMDGTSLLDRSWTRDHALVEAWGGKDRTWATLRTRAYQYVEYYSRDGTIGFREYYDLRKDHRQLRNLLRDGKPQTGLGIEELHRRLALARTCVGNDCP